MVNVRNKKIVDHQNSIIQQMAWFITETLLNSILSAQRLTMFILPTTFSISDYLEIS